jgi:hypothetical protein
MLSPPSFVTARKITTIPRLSHLVRGKLHIRPIGFRNERRLEFSGSHRSDALYQASALVGLFRHNKDLGLKPIVCFLYVRAEVRTLQEAKIYLRG